MVKEQWEAKEKLPQSIVEFVSNTQQKLHLMAELARESDEKAKQKAKAWYDQKARHRPLFFSATMKGMGTRL